MNSLHINEHLAISTVLSFLQVYAGFEPQRLCCLLYSGDAYVSSLECKDLCACTQYSCHLKSDELC